MSGQHHIDRARTEPTRDKAAQRARVAERVNITAREQDECRREGFEAAIRILDRFGSTACVCIEHLKCEHGKRWPNVSD